MRSFNTTCLLLLTIAVAPAQAANETPTVERERSAIKPESLATEEQSGARVWKVTHSNGHVLWLLGTVNPKPKGMTWKPSKAVRDVVADSQLLLRQANEFPANLEVELYTLDPLQRMRAAWHEKLIEDDEEDQDTSLRQTLTPDLYARVQALQEKLLPKSKRRLEKMRPRAVADRLYKAAIDQADLSTRAVIHEEVERIAHRHDVEIENVTLEIRVNLRTAMQIATERSEQPVSAEITCLQATVEQLETQVPVMTTRANAWADGNIELLRQLPLLTRDACNYAAWSAPRWKNLPQQLQQQWLTTVEAGLKKHRSIVALVDISELLKPDGLLAALQSKGYKIEAP